MRGLRRVTRWHMNSLNDIWQEIIKILSKQLTPTAIETWFFRL